MPSTHLVEPDILPFLGLFDSFGYDAKSLATTRVRLLEMLTAAAPPLPAGITKNEWASPIGGKVPPVRMLVYKPKHVAKDRPALLNIHGGGYISGAPEMQEAQNARLAAELDMVVVSPDYRLAPESPFPAAIEDCYAALAWMVSQASELDIDPARIAVSGESAGGGLAAALALLARDRNEYQIAFQRLIYPMIDDRTSGMLEASPYLGQFVWTRESNAFGWSCLLGKAINGSNVSPYAAAARAQDLSGLPPAFIGCGALDFFVDENVDYARRLIHAGVPTELHIYRGAPHGFSLMEGTYACQCFDSDSLSALKRGLQI